jgi:WD40 repeat protein
MTKDTWVFGLRDGSLKVWNLRSEEKLWEIKGHESIITQVAIDPNEQYGVSVSIDQSLKVWNLNSGKHIAPAISKGLFLSVAMKELVTQVRFL